MRLPRLQQNRRSVQLPWAWRPQLDYLSPAFNAVTATWPAASTSHLFDAAPLVRFAVEWIESRFPSA